MFGKENPVSRILFTDACTSPEIILRSREAYSSRDEQGSSNDSRGMTGARRRGCLPFTLGGMAPSERHTECAVGVGAVVRVEMLLGKEGKATVLTNVDTCTCTTAPVVGCESMPATHGLQKPERDKISCKRR